MLLLLQEVKVPVLSVLPRQPQEGKLCWPVDIHGQQGHRGYGDSPKREPEATLHVHRQAAHRHPRICIWRLRLPCKVTQLSTSASCFMYLLRLLVLIPGPLVLLCLFFKSFEATGLGAEEANLYTLNVRRTCSIILCHAISACMVV